MKKLSSIAVHAIILGLIVFSTACHHGSTPKSGTGTKPVGTGVSLYNPFAGCTIVGTKTPITYTVTWHVYTLDASMNTTFYSKGNATETSGAASITEYMNLPSGGAAYQITCTFESNDCTTCAQSCDPSHGGKPHWTGQESWLSPPSGFVPSMAASQFELDDDNCCH